MINLNKGQVINLSKESNGLTQVTVGLGWKARRGTIDLDSYVGAKNAQGKGLNFFYYGHKTDRSFPGVKHNGDDLVGGGRANDPNETIVIKLNELPADATSIIAGLFTFSSGKNFNDVENAFINIVDQDGKELIRYTADKLGKASSLVAGELRKTSNGWSFKALGSVGKESASQVQRRWRIGSTIAEAPEYNVSSEPARRGGIRGFFGV